MAKSISIVIPAYNEERLLQGCLEAISRQSVMPGQVIVVDNNSTDRTADVARSFPFVTLLHESKQGIVHARNRGFDAVTSELIGRIDADSVLPSRWVEDILSFYAQPQHAKHVVNGGARFYNLHSGKLTGVLYDFMVHRSNRFILGYYFPWGSNTALPAAVWRDVKTNVCNNTEVHEDLDLGIHLHDKGYQTVYRPRMRVGVVARRVMNERSRLWAYLRMWTWTMRVHRVRLWPLTVPLSVTTWLGSYCIFAIETVWNMFSPSSRETAESVRSRWS